MFLEFQFLLSAFLINSEYSLHNHNCFHSNGVQHWEFIALILIEKKWLVEKPAIYISFVCNISVRPTYIHRKKTHIWKQMEIKQMF